MAIYRTKKDKENPYVMLNKFFLSDKRLSFKAKGLLAYLLSKPDDWIVMERELVRASAGSRDAVRSGIKELIQTGYIIRQQARGDQGQFGHAEYDVHELPVTPQQADTSPPEELLIQAFREAGAPAEPDEEVRELARQAIDKGRARLRAWELWGKK